MQVKGLAEDTLLDLKDQALDTASRKIGERPDKDNTPNAEVIADYPTVMVVVAVIGVMLVLGFAAVVSFQHIMGAAVPVNEGIRFAGTSYAIMAEFTAIVVMLVIEVFYPGRGWGKLLMLGSLGMAVGLAFVGNWVAIEPETMWEFILVITPPLFTLAMASVIERLTLNWQKGRAAWASMLKERQYEWDAKRLNLEDSQEFINSFANAIWQHVVKTNCRGKNAKLNREYLLGLSQGDKRHLVSREMNRLNWYTSEPNRETVTEREEVKQADSPEELLVSIIPSRDGDSILGVTVTERPSRGFTAQQRKHMLYQDSVDNPRMFAAHTNEQLSEWYGVSTGTVSNVKASLLSAGETLETN